MSVNQKNYKRDYNVVVNSEKQYSVWPTDTPCPGGWQVIEIPDDWVVLQNRNNESNSKKSDRTSCLSYINELWVDMRPLSLQKFLSKK